MDDVEMGESVEIVVAGGRIEAFLSDNVLAFDPKSPLVRKALRVYAWYLAAEGNPAGARDLLAQIGREG